MRKKDSERASKRGQAVIKIQDILNRCFVGRLYDYDNAAAQQSKEELPFLTKKITINFCSVPERSRWLELPSQAGLISRLQNFLPLLKAFWAPSI